jgi:glycosyltransferase involved in cell wall biosynthesis
MGSQMKIGITTYPTAFQSKGGLEVHIKQTLAGLLALGVDARIVDPYHERLQDYDLIHQFSLNHSSFRILQKAKQFGVKIVLTPMVEPISSTWRLRKIRAVRYTMNRVFGSEFRSRWDDTVEGLLCADAITPLTEVERAVIATLAPEVDDRITIIPNGVTEAFFAADPADLLPAHRDLGSFVLVASSIVPYKNQLAVIEAAKALGYRTVLIGSVIDQDYFAQCMRAGGELVTYLGELPYPSRELMALFAAAGLVVLASKIEPFGLVPFEALAAGTPAILTSVSGVTMNAVSPYFQRVDPYDPQAIREALAIGMGAVRNRQACVDIVAGMRWSSVAGMVADVYQDVLQVPVFDNARA